MGRGGGGAYLRLQRISLCQSQMSEEVLAVDHKPHHLGSPLELQHAELRQPLPQLVHALRRQLPPLLPLPL